MALFFFYNIMLEIYIKPSTGWNYDIEEFVNFKGCRLTLEHSLISVSKWESKWKVPFITNLEQKSTEQLIDYIRCMTINIKGLSEYDKDLDPYMFLTADNLKEVTKYIEDSHTASTVKEPKSGRGSGEQVTSELIYYWMVAYNIPVEFERWHLNRLLMLIRICNIKNQPSKKKGNTTSDIAQRKALNAQRRAKYHTRG